MYNMISTCEMFCYLSLYIKSLLKPLQLQNVITHITLTWKYTPNQKEGARPLNQW